MRFEHGSFSCDVEIFYKESDVLVRFYDSSNEQKEDEIVNLVVVDSGYGYIMLKIKGDAGLLSGFLIESVFSSDELVEAAINFVERLSPLSGNIYIPHHVDCIKATSFIEYNGEY